MALDEQLLNRGAGANEGREEEKEAAIQAGLQRAKIQEARQEAPPPVEDFGPDISDEDLDFDETPSRGQQRQGKGKAKSTSAAGKSPSGISIVDTSKGMSINPMKRADNLISRATSKILSYAWNYVIFPSFGSSLIYINLHLFLNKIFPKWFQDFGWERVPDSLKKANPAMAKTMAKYIGYVEKGCCCCLDFCCGGVLMTMILFAAIIVWVAEKLSLEGIWELIQDFWDWIWGT